MTVEKRWEDSTEGRGFWFIIKEGVAGGGFYTESDAIKSLDRIRNGERDCYNPHPEFYLRINPNSEVTT